MTPPKGTPEYELWLVAIEIASKAPARQNGNTYAAKIPWTDIHRLRRALDGVGVNWRNLLPETEKRTYARHEPTDQHLDDEPEGPFLCTCGMAIRWMNASPHHEAGWFCTGLGKPTAAFAKRPPPTEEEKDALNRR